VNVTSGVRAMPVRGDITVTGLPAGTVTFLFTDIEGSTALLQHLGDQRYAACLAQHHEIVCAAFEAGGGRVVDTQGDSFLVAFGNPRDAVVTAAAAQRALHDHPWPDGAPIRVRMGLHTGEPTLAGGHYIGIDVHRAARIMAVGYGGQVLLSHATRDLINGGVPDGLTVRDLGEHRLKDLVRPEHIFQIVIPDLPAEFPPLKTLDIVSNNLPVQLTTFVGRDREIGHVKQTLSEARLLTLMGAGGSGKTRLAIQAAADVIDRFEHGVWLIELAPLADPALVAPAVATTFQVREAAGRSLLDLLVDYLRSKTLLLVLDNCEHVAAGCAQLADTLLRRCPNLRILATSRATLGVAGETTYHVPPLSRPDPKRIHSVEQLQRFEAVQLFVERSVRSQARFALTEANAKAVAEICHRLDGIPLALELAAARVKMLTVEQIATRLTDRFRLLTGGSRTGLQHHQTLRATIDWSHDLLSDEERMLLRRLAAFAGGFTLEAAETVCTGDAVEPFAVLDLLTNLVDKSLVVTEESDDGVRYMLLETIRQYGLEKLDASGETPGVRARHLQWFLELAERAEPELQGADQSDWLGRLELEHDNLRAALDWTASRAQDAEVRARFAAALHRFWSMHGHLTEGRAWLEGAIKDDGPDAAPREEMSPRAKALYGAGVLAFDQGDYARAEVLLEQHLAHARGRDDNVSAARALNHLALIHRTRGEYREAVALLEESQALCRATGQKWVRAQALHALALTVRRLEDYDRATALLEASLPLWRETGDKSGLAKSLAGLGVVARLRGDFAKARTLHEESLAAYRELGHKREVADALLSLGTVARNEGDYARAAALYEECLTISREMGRQLQVAAALVNLANVSHYQGDDDRAGTLAEDALTVLAPLGAKQQIAVCLWTLGNVALARGERERAVDLYRESLSLQRALGDTRGMAECLEALANCAVAADQAERGARLLGAAETLRDATRTPVSLSDRPAYDRSLDLIRDRLREETFSAAWAAGKQAPLEHIINDALGVELSLARET
jgi:predicted ATPase/class 3 adenylate cyclase